MKIYGKNSRRVLASGLALWMALGLCAPAVSAAGPSPTMDETYYATLDYYGGLMDSSVVKSVRTFGNAAFTDYGTYDEVINLTDDRAGTVSGNQLTFDLTGDVPEKFYFEGKTNQPYENFPWKLSLDYKLNGLPANAEELAGQKGVVEITLNAMPRTQGVPEYSRNNLVLTAMSMFNGDDILSLEAPGAQVQLVGNLYCVLYAVLPGEEQHFTIRVGAEEFSYSGMIFLAVPATLDQLSQVADLREAKEKAEDSYHAIQDSLDVLLDSLDGMSGSLNTTADGLDQLNRARGTISKGKGEVYQKLDAALDAIYQDASKWMDTSSDSGEREGEESGEEPLWSSLGPLNLTDALQPMSGHLSSAQQAMTETRDLFNRANENLMALKPEVETSREILTQLQEDLTHLQELAEDLEAYPDWGESIAANLRRETLKLEGNLRSLRRALEGVSGVSTMTTFTVPGTGMTLSELQNTLKTANDLHGKYTAAGLAGQGVSFSAFLQSPQVGLDAETAGKLNQLYQTSQSPDFESQIQQAELADGAIKTVNSKLREANSIIYDITRPTADVVKTLTDITVSLQSLSTLMETLMGNLAEHNGTLSSAADSLKEAADMGVRVSGNLDTALDQLQSLNDIMNTYYPGAQQTMEDTKTLLDSATTSLTALTAAVRAAESLLQSSGTSLDQGTQQALTGLAEALRKSTTGLDQTDTIRNAKETLDALITDEWDSHAGGDNNVLLMDASARPVSLTDSRNQQVTSIQYVMRSQEIKVEDEEDEAEQLANKGDGGTIWSRILDMFRDFWRMIARLFGGGDSAPAQTA